MKRQMEQRNMHKSELARSLQAAAEQDEKDAERLKAQMEKERDLSKLFRTLVCFWERGGVGKGAMFH